MMSYEIVKFLSEQLKVIVMKMLSHPINQFIYSKSQSFDKSARESYFKMLSVALENFSQVYEKKRVVAQE
jgi:hypothetical protein